MALATALELLFFTPMAPAPAPAPEMQFFMVWLRLQLRIIVTCQLQKLGTFCSGSPSSEATLGAQPGLC